MARWFRFFSLVCCWLLALGGPAAVPSAAASPPASAELLAQASVPGGFADEVVAAGLTLPTAFAFLPDNRILIAEKAGRVRLVKNGALLSAPFIDIRDRVNAYWDRGLLGLAVDPNFAANGYVYLLYTYENNAADFTGRKTARLTRVTASGDTAAPSSEAPILGKQVGRTCNDFPPNTDCLVSDAVGHSVGAVKFAADGALFVTIGEGGDSGTVNDEALRTQNLDLLAGKVLRVSPTGAGLPDNPFWTGNAQDNRSKVWAYGLRNPFRFGLRPGANLPYLGDVGWDAWEEINVAVKGANLGWPCYEGAARQRAYESNPLCQALYGQGSAAVTEPLHAYSRVQSSASVTGGAFYTGATFPAEYHGAFFFADYAQGFIKYLKVDANNRLVDQPIDFATDVDDPVDIELGPDGNLYYLSIGVGELRRIRPQASGGPACSIGQFRAEYFNNRTLGGAPSLARCESAIDYDWAQGGPGGGIGNDTFSVRWTGRHQFAAGSYTFVATADDGIRLWVDGALIVDAWRDQGATEYRATRALTAGEHEVRVEYYENGAGALARVTWGQGGGNRPPTATIGAPAPSYRFKVGDVVDFAGSATDPEDGAVPASRLSWEVRLHHCRAGDCHTHSLITATGATGRFTAPDHGDESYFEIVLTATDSAGQATTTSVNIQPQTIQITLASSPPGLQLTYGGTTVTAPTTRAAIVGAAYTIGAPSPQALNGATYGFTSWSDGGAQSHTIVAGTSPATYTAAFTSGGGATACPVGQFKAEYFANRALSGPPATTRCEATIDNQWRGDGPSGVGSDDFSIRWTGRHRFDAGDYTFTAAADDGVRVWLDGALVVDAWRDQPPTQYQATRSVTAGEHEVKVDYYERDGGAVARVTWSPAAAGCPVGHYLAEYYPNRALWGNPAIRRCEATIDHQWGRAGPVPGVGPDDFSVRWTGRHRLDAGEYAYTAVADDGVRVWIDDSLLIDAWRDQGATGYTATRALTAGEHAIRVEYYENGVDAVARFTWGRAGP